MRQLTMIGLLIGVTTNVASAQVAPPPQAAAKPSPSAREEILARNKAYEAAVTDCEQMWDRGTHMTKQDWSRTCRRVQDRFRRHELK